MTQAEAPGERSGAQRPEVVDLLEREHELGAIEELLDRAARGEGCVLLIAGSAGIGKTELLRRAGAGARERGMRALAACGGELESELPFVIVRELLAGVVERAPAAERDELMAGAARLAAPVLGSRSTQAQDNLALADALHGLFWLCSNLAERRPLLLAIDDLQWVDTASLRFLAYVARRIRDLPALLAVGLRTGEARTDEDAIGTIRREAADGVLMPQPLSMPAVAHVLGASYAGAEVAEEFAQACHNVTGGNPFFLRELLAALRDEGVRPQSAEAARVEEVRPHGVAVAVRARLDRLSSAAAELAQAIAVLGLEAELRRAARLAGVTEEAAGRAADELAAAELIERRRPLAFRHPLIRGAVHDELLAGRRASAHAHAAHQLLEDGAPSESVAAHLLHAEPARDERAVAVLRDAAGLSLRRGVPQQAVSYLRRALTEPPGHELHPSVLRELGAAELAAGDPNAATHLTEALALAEDDERAAVAEQLTVALDAAGRHQEAVAMLRSEIGRVRPVDPDAALRLQAAMLGSAALSGRAIPEARELLRWLASQPGETEGQRVLLAAAAWYVIFSGGKVQQAVDLGRRGLSGDRLLREQPLEAPAFWLGSAPLLLGDRHDEHLAHIEAAERAAAERGSVVGSALVLTQRALNAYLRGAIAEAADYARDGLDRTLAAGWLGGLPAAASTLVLALIERDELAEGERVFDALGLSGELPPHILVDTLLVARGTLRLAQARPAEALEDLREAGRRQGERGVQMPFPVFGWHASAVRALSVLGESEEARRTAMEWLRLARRVGGAATIAAALRSLAATEEGTTRVARLHEALSLLEGSRAGLERMRALVDLGAALRRERKVSESREPLGAALELAEPAGAEAIAERARAELAATGARRRRRTFLSGAESLTPSERRAATLAAEGMSNPEIAQRLFVTRKTVENYLGKVYAKLGISSRAQLADKLGEPDKKGEPPHC